MLESEIVVVILIRARDGLWMDTSDLTSTLPLSVALACASPVEAPTGPRLFLSVLVLVILLAIIGDGLAMSLMRGGLLERMMGLSSLSL
jgi:hypothetical protein